MPRRRGFSLVELLVVIGMIAILIGLLLPALIRARESAKSIKCAAQLSEIGKAIFAYATWNKGKTPCWSWRHEWPNDPNPPVAEDPNWSGPGWPVLLIPYLGHKPDGAVWNCPGFPQDKRVNYFIGARWMHEQVPLIRSMPLSRIKTASTYLLAAECTAQNYYPPAYGEDLTSEFEDIDKDDGATNCLVFSGESGGFNMHRSGNNILFGDGHVAFFKKYDPTAITSSPFTMKTWEQAGPE
ncbi:MAG TPA: type II secretion system protein [Tepidisphaeraceae bacterium]|jgi:prepilin-type N-terminal cleavage/methylation domain-containing protein/prepilin-type processing-associated H-X9-DG protein